MASIDRHPRTGNWRVRFRFGTRHYHLSLDTGNEKQARLRLALVDETLDLLKRGILSIPSDSGYREAGMFVLTGGKVAALTAPVEKPTLAEIIQEYLDELPSGAKADSTTRTEHIHLEHFKRLLGRSTRFDTIGTGQRQSYVNQSRKKRGARERFTPIPSRRNWGRFRYSGRTRNPEGGSKVTVPSGALTAEPRQTSSGPARRRLAVGCLAGSFRYVSGYLFRRWPGVHGPLRDFLLALPISSRIDC